jgi:hypothetical protein
MWATRVEAFAGTFHLHSMQTDPKEVGRETWLS